MSLPTHIDAYDDCMEYFQQALDDDLGLRIKFTDFGQANLFTLRMHQARALQRQLHRRLYPESDIRYGRSEFDKLTVRQPKQDTEDMWWVYIERSNSRVVTVESLSQPATGAE